MARRVKPGADAQLTGDKAVAKQIAAARAAFNTALSARDYDGIALALCEECTLVPGDDAELMAGREAQLSAWRSIITQAPDVSYVRTPMRIDVGEDGLLAAETGRWKGQWSAQGFEVRYSGRYFAKWRLDGDDWRIASEVFVTLKREGGAAGA
jgi:ketosteroid isomerase-like protein